MWSYFNVLIFNDNEYIEDKRKEVGHPKSNVQSINSAYFIVLCQIMTITLLRRLIWDPT